MTIRAFLLAATLAGLASAQLQISLYDGKTEKPLTAVTDLGVTAMGDATEYRFHARNSTNASIALQAPAPIKVAGQGFEISDLPAIPYIISPGSFVEFRVRFAPYDTGSYSATLTVNGISTLLRATATAAPLLWLISNGPASVLAAGSPIDFGRVQKKQSASRTLRLANGAATALTVNTISVGGTVFHGAAVKTPLQMLPGDAVEFQVTFDPQTSGQYNGSLAIDNRSFALTGVSYDPPLPTPSLSVAGEAASASLDKITVRFDTAPETSGNGTLALDFRPTIGGVADDPNVVFYNGARKLSFAVIEDDPVASFAGLRDVPLLTGTTAGIITLTLQLGDYTRQTTIEIPAAPVKIDKAFANRRTSDLDVTLTAFDNTRTAGQFTFTFYDTAGQVVPPGAIRVDSTADFGRYFAISRVGGSFLTRLTFPVSGDATRIAAVEVDLTNKAGKTQTGRLNLQ